MDLDRVDMGILSILIKNARTSFRKMASSLKVSVPTISSKVSKLESIGLIQGYKVELDLDLLSNRQVFVFIKAKPSKLDSIAKRIGKLPQCTEVHVLTGAQILARCLFESTEKEMKLIDEISKIDDVSDYSIFATLSSRTKGPESLISEKTSLIIDCYYCRKPMYDEPVTIKLDGKNHYLCCNTCKREYLKKYKALKEKADLPSLKRKGGSRKPHHH